MDNELREPRDGWLDRSLTGGFRLDAEVLIYGLILVAAVLTRFLDLGARAVSHDEVTHVFWSYNLFRGLGFQHNPLSHGPLQFHLIALSYTLFGANDFTARIPQAIAGVAAVGMMPLFRRWLGRAGALVAAALMLFSPFMLYYSRYARNEALVVVEGLAMFWAVFRYFETRRPKWLYLLAASLALHFATKETSFIYVAQLLIFLVGHFVWDVLRRRWSRPGHKWVFGGGLVVAALGGGVTFLGYFRNLIEVTKAFQAGTEITAPALPPLLGMGLILVLGGTLLLVASLLSEFGSRLRTEFPALDLLVISGTLVLTQLSAFALPPEVLARYGDGGNPQELLDPVATQRLIFAIPLLLILAAAVGIAWDWRRWGVAAGIAAALYVPLYTTLFTHALGLTTGAVGSLGYWLGNQGVERGSQPWYYYLGLQVPVYEFLPALGVLGALGVGLARAWKRRATAHVDGTDAAAAESSGGKFPVLGFLGYWVVTSVLAYTYAGEKMPWLTVHIALAMILLAGWMFGRLLEGVEWGRLRDGRSWALAGVLLLGLIALARGVGILLGPNPPFSNVSLDGLNATLGFLTAAASVAAAVLALAYLSRGWTPTALVQLGLLLVTGALFAVTIRASLRAAFVNYDNATEYLVYAHSATGPKTLLAEVMDLSLRTTDGTTIDVAYDDKTSYPFMWYLREFPNTHPFGATPSRDLLNYPLIIAGDTNWSRVEPLLGDRYHQFEYTRMWWPMMDYWGLTWERVWNALASASYRQALWDIWLDRDYTAFGNLTARDFSLNQWSPAERMRLYVRKDVAALVWDYGALPASLQPIEFVDPYEEGMTDIPAEIVLGLGGTADVQFSMPRSLDVAPDGTLYVADTGNHRIIHLTVEGQVLATWGSFADLAQGAAPGGTFNEPWDVAVAPNGTVYVADTWNHRVQWFSRDGEFRGMFGTFGAGDEGDTFWGPRAVAVDSRGRVFVADTGNKRIAVFDARGAFITDFGSPGYDPGQLNEPVGIAFAPDGTLLVADTWNGRIQGFREVEPDTFEAVLEWPIEAWFGQSLDNKPYLAASATGDVCTTEPEGYRILCFNMQGQYQIGWGNSGIGVSQVDLPTGIDFDAQGNLWLADTGNDRILRFAWPLP